MSLMWAYMAVNYNQAIKGNIAIVICGTAWAQGFPLDWPK